MAPVVLVGMGDRVVMRMDMLPIQNVGRGMQAADPGERQQSGENAKGAHGSHYLTEKRRAIKVLHSADAAVPTLWSKTSWAPCSAV